MSRNRPAIAAILGRMEPGAAMRRIILCLALGMGLATGLGEPAQAALVVRTDSFAGATDLLGFAPFDPALGTLNRVDVVIDGQLTVNGVTAPNFSVPPNPVPIPYPTTIRIDQDFFPSGPGPQGFEFATPATFVLDIPASGAGESVLLVVPFRYDFSFTAASDVIGFVIPSFGGPTTPPTSIIGQRDDFVTGLPGLAIQTVVQHQATQLLGLPFQSLAASGSGAVIITFDFTPALVAMAAPATLPLLGGGLGLLLLPRLLTGGARRLHRKTCRI